jgi:hypothetical protein
MFIQNATRYIRVLVYSYVQRVCRIIVYLRSLQPAPVQPAQQPVVERVNVLNRKQLDGINKLNDRPKGLQLLTFIIEILEKYVFESHVTQESLFKFSFC